MKLDRVLESKDLMLRAPAVKDLAGNWYKWLNDPEVTRYQNKGHYKNTRKKQGEYLEATLKNDRDVLFAIIDKRTGRHIGSAGLHKIDAHNRSADLGIMIGEKQFWGRGYGRTAWNMVAYYGFKRLRLRRIQATVFKDNLPSLRSAFTSGFRKEGLMRDLFIKKGVSHSAFMTAALERDFRKMAGIRMRKP